MSAGEASTYCETDRDLEHAHHMAWQVYEAGQWESLRARKEALADKGWTEAQIARDLAKIPQEQTATKMFRVRRGDPDPLPVHTDETGNIPLHVATAGWPQLISGTQLIESKHGSTKGYWFKEPNLGWIWTSDDNGIIAMAIREDKAFTSLPTDTRISWIQHMALVPKPQRAEALEDALHNKYTGCFMTRYIDGRWGKKSSKSSNPTNIVPQNLNYNHLTDTTQARHGRQHPQHTAGATDVCQVSDKDVINTWLYNHPYDIDSEEENYHIERGLKKAKNNAPWDNTTHVMHRAAKLGGLSPRTKAAYHRELHRNTTVTPDHQRRGHATTQH
jgi:hypothetical protein